MLGYLCMTKGMDPCFAVLRFDNFLLPTTPLSERISVKVIVWTEHDAEREVERLTALNGDKGCEYFWLKTRAWPRP